MNGRGFRMCVLAMACAGMTGCRHKVKPVIPQAAQTPVPLEKVPDSAPQLAQIPLTPAPLPAIKVPEKKTRRQRRTVAPPAAQPPAQVASAGPAPTPGAAIGALTIGGEQTPERKRQAEGMIAELDKRLAGLTSAMLERQKEGIVRVRYFERQAKTALGSGDAEGAVTLATKARVLLDDLVK